MVKYAMCSLALAGAVSACNEKSSASTREVARQQIGDVPYGSDSAQKMDVYLPAARTVAKTKVLVFIHGGSWSGGDKSEFDQAIVKLQSQLPDYAMFNINYRLSSRGANRYPVQSNDVKLALDFINKHAAGYMINPNKIGLIGASAGAHLALLQAYRFNKEGRIKAVVDLFGPTDLTSLYNNHPFPDASRSVLVNLLGTRPTTNATVYEVASPINFVSAQSPPTLIFHGGLDIINPIQQSLELQVKLTAANAKVELVTYAGEGHGWQGNNLADTYARVITFIRQNLK